MLVIMRVQSQLNIVQDSQKSSSKHSIENISHDSKAIFSPSLSVDKRAVKIDKMTLDNKLDS